MSSSQVVVACDIDEVVFPYLSGWVDYYNRTHNSTVKVSDFHSYNFAHVLVDHDEDYITTLVYDFHDAPEFLNILPLEGAVDAIKLLQEVAEVHFVTSRQEAIAQVTCDWIYQHFGIKGEKIHIGNHWCKDTDAVTTKKTKSDMCRLINAKILIDDSVSYVQECAAADMKALLFDLNGSYGWNKLPTGESDLHDNVTRVTSWEETLHVVRQLVGE